MGPDRPSFDSIKQGFEHTHLSVHDIWLIYYSLGGTATSGELEAYLVDEGPLEAAQQTVLAQSVNEVFLDAGLDHPVPYPER